MIETLAEWENYFEAKILHGQPSNRTSHAPLLHSVPDRVTWDGFLESVHGEWQIWKGKLSKCPASLLMLYCGLAFYEYDENTFWPQFAKVVGADDLPPNQQTEINGASVHADLGESEHSDIVV
jgi:hypothetical protein